MFMNELSRKLALNLVLYDAVCRAAARFAEPSLQVYLHSEASIRQSIAKRASQCKLHHSRGLVAFLAPRKRSTEEHVHFTSEAMYNKHKRTKQTRRDTCTTRCTDR